MEESIRTLEGVVRIFFQENKFAEAENQLLNHPDFGKSVYITAGPAYMSGIFALLTMEQKSVETGLFRSKQLISLCEKQRRSSRVSDWFFRQNMNDYSDTEAHAEVMTAEANLLNMLCTILSDPNLYAIVRMVFRFRSCYNALIKCGQIFKEKTNWKSQTLKRNFEVAYKIGWGYYNIVVSHLPQRVLQVMAVVGLQSDREIAHKYCYETTMLSQDTFLGKVSSFLFCFYSFYLEQFFGCGTAELDWVKQITDRELRAYPDSAFDLFYAARSAQLSGDMDSAIRLFNRCIDSQSENLTIHSVCKWDLLWSHAMTQDWETAARYALELTDTCNWSKATNLYQNACFRYMMLEQKNRTSDSEAVNEIIEVMKRVPDYKKKIAGRTIPPEKFAITKANEYSTGRKELVLPALELLYMWNIFGSAAKNPRLLDPFVQMIDQKMKELEGVSEQFYTMLLLKGVCLRNQGKNESAISCFNEILDNEKGIKELTYIPPHAAFELGLTLINCQDLSQAKHWLERSRDHYTGFLVESLVHLRIHGALSKIRLMEQNGDKIIVKHVNDNNGNKNIVKDKNLPEIVFTSPTVSTVDEDEEISFN